MHTNFVANYTTTIKAPIEKVWDALINPEIVKQYFFGTDLSCDWKVGSPIVFSGEYEGTAYADRGTILSYEHNHKLEFSYVSNWSGLADEPENYLHVTYKVTPTEDGTELTILQSNYDEEKAKHSEENWKSVIDGLKQIVE